MGEGPANNNHKQSNDTAKPTINRRGWENNTAALMERGIEKDIERLVGLNACFADDFRALRKTNRSWNSHHFERPQHLGRFISIDFPDVYLVFIL